MFRLLKISQQVRKGNIKQWLVSLPSEIREAEKEDVVFKLYPMSLEPNLNRKETRFIFMFEKDLKEI
jgi:hypothetical protein